MSTLCLTGWQQPPDALSLIAPDALHLDYSAHANVASVYDLIEPHGTVFDTVIGWSLGGQIALNLLDQGKISCNHLVLLSVAWQLVQSREITDATPPDILDETIRGYRRDPAKTLEGFAPLLVMNDVDQKELTREFLRELPSIWPSGSSWLKFLKEFSCSRLSFHDMPKRITIIHGDADVIAPVTQLGYFREALPKADIYVIEGCAHAPHWHDPESVRRMII